MMISQAGVDSMVAWCRRGLPLEACGLFGWPVGAEERITHLWPCRNAAQSTHQFRIAQDELERIVAQAARSRLIIVGGWHSHVASPAVPSKADLQLAPYPEWVSIIVSLYPAEPEVRAWQGMTELEMITR